MSGYPDRLDVSTQANNPQHNRTKWDYYPLRVSRIIRETEEACSIVFEIPADLQELFHYEAGQYLTINVALDGENEYRCYSLASSPATDAETRVTVKAVPGGRISVWCNTMLREGDTVKVMPPGGRFTLRQNESSVLFFSGGSGITPCFSILKTVLATTDRRVKLLYANQNKHSIIFHDELEKIQQRYPARFELIHNLDVENGFVNAELVQATIKGWENSECYICGPAPFMDVVEKALLEAHFSHEKIHIERFVVTRPEAETAVPDKTATEVIPEKVTISFKGQTHEVPYRAGETVFDAARLMGVRLPIACKLGNCGTCIAKIQEGSVRMKVNNVLTPEEVKAGYVLVCQSIPTAGRITIEYE